LSGKLDKNLASDDSVEDPSGDSLSDDYLDDSQSQSELEALEQRRRALQGEADKQRAKVQRLEAQLSEYEGLQAKIDALESKLSELKVPTVEDLASVLDDRERHTRFQNDLKERYPSIDLKKVQGSSFEEMEASAKALEAERKDYADQIRSEVEAEVRKQYADRLGDLDTNFVADDQGEGGDADAGAMSLEKFLEMSPEESVELSDEEFAHWARVAEENGYV